MYCYYKARRDQPRGYRKRMHQLWQQRGNFECTEQQICDQKKQIKDVWLVAWDVPICFDLVVPQDGCLLILHYSFWIVLVPVLHIHFDSNVLAYIQMQLGSYLVVPVKVIIIIIIVLVVLILSGGAVAMFHWV